MEKNALLDRVALVTGAGRRIGAEIARTLHENGMNIILHYNMSENDADALSLEFNQKRKKSAIAIRANLSVAGVESILINEGVNAWGHLDLLVNNASRFYRTDLGNVSQFAWEDLMNSNTRAPFFLSQAAAPHLAKTKGSIVNITDIHADNPMRDYSVYCISKSALLMMTKVLAKELGPDIRVNAVAPGAIIWPEGENTLSDEEKENIIADTVLKRVGNATDIAKTVLYFVRDAEYVTGQVINVDGGRSLS